MINASVLQRLPALSQAFASARPFRHVVIDDFLDPEFCTALHAHFPQFDDRYALNEMGVVGGKAVRTEVRDLPLEYRALDETIQGAPFLDLVSGISGIPDLLYDPDYVGGGTHENRDGQRLEVHVDFNYHPGTRWHRRLNLIVYLNPQWESGWGGNLELQSDPWNPHDNRVLSVAPIFNRAVLFETTENSWHGFDAITLPDEHKALSRKSFAIYLYTRERQAAETAPAHATVYVPMAMPENLQQGHTLSHGDLLELERRFNHLRGQLHFVYEREKHFAEQIASLEYALTEVRAALRIPLQGYAAQERAPDGMWPDAWVGQELRFWITPVRRVRALSLKLWCPLALAGEQQISLQLNGQSRSYRAKPGKCTSLRFNCELDDGAEWQIIARSERVWSPAAGGESADDRQLAFRLLGVELEH